MNDEIPIPFTIAGEPNVIHATQDQMLEAMLFNEEKKRLESQDTATFDARLAEWKAKPQRERKTEIIKALIRNRIPLTHRADLLHLGVMLGPQFANNGREHQAPPAILAHPDIVIRAEECARKRLIASMEVAYLTRELTQVPWWRWIKRKGIEQRILRLKLIAETQKPGC